MGKRTIILITTLLLGVITIFSACGRNETSTNRMTTTEAESETSTISKEKPTTKNDAEKILVAYFTWAENTTVENPDAVDTDATTSASVLAPGNVGRIADRN